jgi:hypothetical protein
VKSDNAFRFEEYRDLDKGFTGGMDIRGYSGAWWYNLFGENIARDDQFIQLKGGRYGLFKFAIYGDDIIHNTTFGAVAPWTGIGTNHLNFTGTAPSTNVSTWNRFDYGVKHENIGGFAEGQPTVDSPLYFRLSTNRQEERGDSSAGRRRHEPGGPRLRASRPDRLDDDGHHRRDRLLLPQDAPLVAYTVQQVRGQQRVPVLAHAARHQRGQPEHREEHDRADNKLERLALNGVFRGLWLDSTLAVRGVHTKTTNGFAIFPTFLSVSAPNGFDRLSGASQPNFTGDVVNDSVSVAFNSHLAKGWDSKVYYNWYKRENDSSRIVFTPERQRFGRHVRPECQRGVAHDLHHAFLHYEKKNAGDRVLLPARPGQPDRLRLRLPRHRARARRLRPEHRPEGVDRVEDERPRVRRPAREVPAHLARRQLRGRDLRKRLRPPPIPLRRGPARARRVQGHLRREPRADVRRRHRGDLQGEPLQGDDPRRTKDQRQELNFSASYGDMKVFRITAFADVEHTQYDSNHWVGDITNFPTENPSGGIYAWAANVKDRNWLVGAAADWVVNERLRVHGSYIWTKANGEVDFSAPASANALPIDNYDNYRKQQLDVKATYAATKNRRRSRWAARTRSTRTRTSRWTATTRRCGRAATSTSSRAPTRTRTTGEASVRHPHLAVLTNLNMGARNRAHD